MTGMGERQSRLGIRRKLRLPEGKKETEKEQASHSGEQLETSEGKKKV